MMFKRHFKKCIIQLCSEISEIFFLMRYMPSVFSVWFRICEIIRTLSPVFLRIIP